MIRHHDTIRASLDCQLGIFGRHDALDDERQVGTGLHLQPSHVVPRHVLFEHLLDILIPRTLGLAIVRLLQLRGRVVIVDQPMGRGQGVEAVAIVGLTVSKPQGIHGQEDPLVPGTHCALHEVQRDCPILEDVGLVPFRGVRCRPRHLLDCACRVLGQTEQHVGIVACRRCRAFPTDRFAEPMDTGRADKDGHGHGLAEEGGSRGYPANRPHHARSQEPAFERPPIFMQGLLIIGSGRQVLVPRNREDALGGHLEVVHVEETIHIDRRVGAA
mmetsp:Transcript_24416/g.68035  ORF Transcript_24416/g.68035 Transcript_24416/m.68035 type:complete len:272 (+) Transcript_24416:642-1457(+)